MVKDRIKSKIPKFGIGIQVAIVFTIIFVIIVSFLLSYGLSRFYNYFIDAEIVHMEDTGAANRDFFENWFSQRREEMKILAESDDAKKINKQRLEVVLNGLAIAGYYDTIYVVGTDGLGIIGVEKENGVIIYAEDEASNFDVADRDWFLEAVSGNHAVSEPLISRSTGNHIISIASPIIDEAGEIIGVMRGAVLLDTIFNVVSEIDIRSDLQVYIIDINGDIIVTNDDSLSDVKKLDTKPVADIGEGISGSGVYTNIHNVDVIGSYTYIPFLNWGLVMEEDYASTLHPFKEAGDTFILSFITILFVFMLIGLILVIRIVTKPLEQSNMKLEEAYDETIVGWSKALELRDNETHGHCLNVAKMTLEMARMANIDREMYIHIYRGALLHDIGKIGIPDAILKKPDTLNAAEWRIMHRHPIIAYEMLFQIQYLHPALNIPYCHHEKWDGTGYPRKLRKTQIPVEARIFAIVDVYDALTSDRPYRGPWNKHAAEMYIKEQSGKHFDPEIVKLFLRFIDEPNNFIKDIN